MGNVTNDDLVEATQPPEAIPHLYPGFNVFHRGTYEICAGCGDADGDCCQLQQPWPAWEGWGIRLL